MNVYLLAVGLLFPPHDPFPGAGAVVGYASADDGCPAPLTTGAAIAATTPRIAPAARPLRIHRPGWPAYTWECQPGFLGSSRRWVSEDGTTWIRGRDGRLWILCQ